MSFPRYHAHIYYDAKSRHQPARLRQLLDTTFRVRLGRRRERPAGPHPRPMYPAAFAGDPGATACRCVTACTVARQS